MNCNTMDAFIYWRCCSHTLCLVIGEKEVNKGKERYENFYSCLERERGEQGTVKGLPLFTPQTPIFLTPQIGVWGGGSDINL